MSAAERETSDRSGRGGSRGASPGRGSSRGSRAGADKSASGKPRGTGKAGAGKAGAGRDRAGKGASGKTGKGASSKDRAGKGPSSKPRGAGAERGRADRPERAAGPRIPDDITGQEIDRRVAAELRTLPEGLAEKVARLLVAVSMTIDDDPEAALAFAREAKRKAARVAPVREAVALAAYAAGDYAEALSELRAVRRMTGDDAHVPLMADCERGLGRPRKALELLASVPEDSLPPEARVEARIVAAGARRDLGQPEAALLLLQVPALNSRRTDLAIARLRYAYADTLAELGRTDEAALWFERAMAADPEATTDAADRLAELQGVTFGDDWDDGDVSD